MQPVPESSYSSMRRWFVGAAFSSVFWLAGCAENQDVRLEPSGAGLPFDASNYRDFADYTLKTRTRLERSKVFVDPDNAARELETAVPFETLPAQGCTDDGPSKGILLIHGLSDMPFAMHDLAEAFADRCFLARTVLLPGHGTRPGDLLEVSREDWLDAARFGVATLETDVDEVYVGGFSLGGLIALHTAMDDTKIAGVFAFSPAWKLQSARSLSLTPWLRHFVDWIDQDAPDDYARYEAMPMNGLAETYLLTRDLAKKLDTKTLETPVFLAQSAQDVIIDTKGNAEYFTQHLTSEQSRAIFYTLSPEAGQADPRWHNVDSALPEQRIIGFSHQALHIAPDNPHYGKNGAYRNCGINAGRSAEMAERCLEVEQPWRTEIIGHLPPQMPKDVVPARLTFNPFFDNMMAAIDNFLVRQNDR